MHDIFTAKDIVEAIQSLSKDLKRQKELLLPLIEHVQSVHQAIRDSGVTILPGPDLDAYVEGLTRVRAFITQTSNQKQILFRNRKQNKIKQQVKTFIAELNQYKETFLERLGTTNTNPFIVEPTAVSSGLRTGGATRGRLLSQDEFEVAFREVEEHPPPPPSSSVSAASSSRRVIQEQRGRPQSPEEKNANFTNLGRPLEPLDSIGGISYADPVPKYPAEKTRVNMDIATTSQPLNPAIVQNAKKTTLFTESSVYSEQPASYAGDFAVHYTDDVDRIVLSSDAPGDRSRLSIGLGTAGTAGGASNPQLAATIADLESRMEKKFQLAVENIRLQMRDWMQAEMLKVLRQQEEQLKRETTRWQQSLEASSAREQAQRYDALVAERLVTQHSIAAELCRDRNMLRYGMILNIVTFQSSSVCGSLAVGKTADERVGLSLKLISTQTSWVITRAPLKIPEHLQLDLKPTLAKDNLVRNGDSIILRAAAGRNVLAVKVQDKVSQIALLERGALTKPSLQGSEEWIIMLSAKDTSISFIACGQPFRLKNVRSGEWLYGACSASAYENYSLGPVWTGSDGTDATDWEAYIDNVR